MSKKKAVVDQNKCIGCNTCPLVDADTFELDTSTFKAVVKATAPDPNEKTDMAMSSCPVGAISIVEE